MIFHEIYSLYYRTVADILACAVKNELTEEKLTRIAAEGAFKDSHLTILPALKEQKWKLLEKDGTTPLKHVPELPLSHLQKRWLKSVSLDPRIRLFLPESQESVRETRADGKDTERGNETRELFFLEEEIKPLFTPEDFTVFDRYGDGDPYDDENYVSIFRTVLRAVKEKRELQVEYTGGAGYSSEFICRPLHIEYSEKDDKFRVFAARGERTEILNMARITSCRLSGEGPQENKTARKAGAKNRSFFRMELKDERSALERAMLHFAHFQKEAERIDGDRYLITIYYDREDEAELIIRVLSFGPFVKVTEPASFVSLVKDRIERQRKFAPFFP